MTTTCSHDFSWEWKWIHFETRAPSQPSASPNSEGILVLKKEGWTRIWEVPFNLDHDLARSIQTSSIHLSHSISSACCLRAPVLTLSQKEVSSGNVNIHTYFHLRNSWCHQLSAPCSLSFNDFRTIFKFNRQGANFEEHRSSITVYFHHFFPLISIITCDRYCPPQLPS